MRLSLHKVTDRLSGHVPTRGDVYLTKGGTGETVAWVVIAIHGKTVILLGINEFGEPVSTRSYPLHQFLDRKLVGHCPDLANLSFDVERVA